MLAAKRLIELAEKDYPTKSGVQPGSGHCLSVVNGRLCFTLMIPCELKSPPCWEVYFFNDDDMSRSPDDIWQEIKRIGWERS